MVKDQKKSSEGKSSLGFSVRERIGEIEYQKFMAKFNQLTKGKNDVAF